MKRGKSFLAAAVIVAAAFGMLPARAGDSIPPLETSSHAGCAPVDDGTVSGHAYMYCGYHWAATPVKFRVLKDGVPSSIGNAFQHIVDNAATEWNRWWPRKGLSCGALLCDKSTDATVANTISFGSLPEGVLGQTEVTSNGAIITQVRILLSNTVSWHAGNGIDIFTGEQSGVAASVCAGPTCKVWFDLQDVITHELGHFIGLEDLGNESECLADLAEAVDFAQTMYGCFWRGDTSKRSLGWGDIAGLYRIAQEY